MHKKKTEIAAGTGSIKTGKKNFFLFISILAVVAVSGCIVPGGDVFAGMFGPQRPATTEASADLITTQNMNIIPSPPISAENSFTVSFEVKNNDENEEVKNVLVNYYDTGLCKAGKNIIPSGESTVGGLVADEMDVKVAHFTTACSGKTTNIHLVNRNDQNSEGYLFSATDQKLCDDKNCEDAGCQVTVIDNDRVSFKTGNQAEVTFTTTDKTKTYDGKTVTFNGVSSVKKSKCVSDASCERTPGDADTACKKISSTRFVGDISDTTYCYPWYGDSGFSSYCYKCDYTSTSLPAMPDSTQTKAGAKTYYPLQTELKEWDFTAPSNSEIGNMPRTCGIKYKITYDFTAKTQTDVSVISKGKMEEMQRAGQEPFANPMQSVGVGPIKVFFDFGASQPIKSGDVLPVFITVEDRGTGIYSKVLAGKLKIKMPTNFEKIVCDKFTDKGGGVFENSAEIPLIKKTSPQLRCSFKMPSVTDIKTFYITAELPYEYKLDDEISVSVNPTLVR